LFTSLICCPVWFSFLAYSVRTCACDGQDYLFMRKNRIVLCWGNYLSPRMYVTGNNRFPWTYQSFKRRSALRTSSCVF